MNDQQWHVLQPEEQLSAAQPMQPPPEPVQEVFRQPALARPPPPPVQQEQRVINSWSPPAQEVLQKCFTALISRLHAVNQCYGKPILGRLEWLGTLLSSRGQIHLWLRASSMSAPDARGGKQPCEPVCAQVQQQLSWEPAEPAHHEPQGEGPLAGENVMNVVLVGAECSPWSKTGAPDGHSPAASRQEEYGCEGQPSAVRG